MSASTTTPRIYVASLSDYNAGILHGAWIDANQSPDDIQAEVDAMLATSKQDVAEEWAIHDYEGFAGLKIDEYQSFEDVSSMAAAIEEYGPAFAAWHNNAPDYNTDVSDFQDAYIGEYDSVEDYAYEIYQEQYSRELNNLPDILRNSIDWKSVAEELENGDIWTHEESGSVYIFRNC